MILSLLICLGQRLQRCEIKRLAGTRLSKKIEQIVGFVEFVLVDATPSQAMTNLGQFGFLFKRFFVQRSRFVPSPHLFQMRCQPRTNFGTVRELFQNGLSKLVRLLMHVKRHQLRVSDQCRFLGRFIAVFLQCTGNRQLPGHLVLFGINDPVATAARTGIENSNPFQRNDRYENDHKKKTRCVGLKIPFSATMLTRPRASGDITLAIIVRSNSVDRCRHSADLAIDNSGFKGNARRICQPIKGTPQPHDFRSTTCPRLERNTRGQATKDSKNFGVRRVEGASRMDNVSRFQKKEP